MKLDILEVHRIRSKLASGRYNLKAAARDCGLSIQTVYSFVRAKSDSHIRTVQRLRDWLRDPRKLPLE